MMKKKEKVYVFGHRNPDTDSVTAAISLAHLKNKLGVNAVAAVLSSLNLETKYALDYFKVKEPIFLNDVKIKVKDLKYTKNYMIHENDSIYSSYYKMEKAGISKIPVVDKGKKMLGIVSMKDIAREQFSREYDRVDALYKNIIDVIDGNSILKFDDVIQGNLLVAGFRSATFIEEVNLSSDHVLIVGDRHSIIEYAIESKVKLIVITGNHQIKSEHLKLARKNKVNIITTSLSTLQTSKIFNLCNRVKTLIKDTSVLCIDENEDLNEFIKIANKTRYSYYPVLGKNQQCLGILRFSDVGYGNKKNVILVDHNSYEQSAIGLEEANILEIIDHHNIGSIGTNMPIAFRNMPVGSTNTIIYMLYKEAGVNIPKDIAGLMLSGILSDTLILTSPTTTDIDVEVVKKLSKLAKVDYKKYGFDMIKAGTSLKGKTLEEILYTDFKTYTVDNKRIGLGQIMTTNIDEVEAKVNEYVDMLDKLCDDNEYYFINLYVTDILKNGTYVLYSKNAKSILESAFNVDDIEQLHYLDKVISRKKQILPAIMNEMQ